MANIWLIGGTSESAQLAKLLSEQDLPYVVTVTTPEAKRLYLDYAQVQVGLLNAQSISQFVSQWNIKGILDASHPFACEISQLAIRCAQTHGIAYLRYERATVTKRDTTNKKTADRKIGSKKTDGKKTDSKKTDDEECKVRDIYLENLTKTQEIEEITETREQSIVVLAKSISELVESDILRGQRVLFTIGYRYLSLFSSLRADSQLFARILPSKAAITGAIAAGFSPSEIIAIRPPISADLECALWKQWQITRVVAKASGSPGGEDVKRAIARHLGIPLLLIERPCITYPNRTISISAAIEFCIKTLKVY